MNMNKRIAAATASALSIILFSGCTGILEAAYVARDMKKASDDYEQAQHEERVDRLNRDYEEFRSKMAATDPKRTFATKHPNGCCFCTRTIVQQRV
jgi:hypothetical protein